MTALTDIGASVVIPFPPTTTLSSSWRLAIPYPAASKSFIKVHALSPNTSANAYPSYLSHFGRFTDF